jgi:NAD(P)-dependent dehydrogenase (short-subunit alcohol dehydrogenase family)
VICNAGIVNHVPFSEMDPGEFTQMLAVHVLGSFNVARAAWQCLAEQQYGRVVLTTSGSGLYGSPQSTHYATAKAAIIGMTRSLALEGRSRGIKVNAVSPGGFTRMNDEVLDDAEHGELKELLRSAAPPEKVSPTYVWLSHEDCQVSGEILEVMGGRTARIFIAQTPGFVTPDPSPEDIRDHWDQIVAEDGYAIPPDMATESTQWMRSIQTTS